MSHISRKVRKQVGEVFPSQRPFFQAGNGQAMPEVMDSRTVSGVRDIRHKEVVPEMVVCGTAVHSAVFPWKEVCIWFAKAVESLHINRQSFH